MKNYFNGLKSLKFYISCSFILLLFFSITSCTEKGEFEGREVMNMDEIRADLEQKIKQAKANPAVLTSRDYECDPPEHDNCLELNYQLEGLIDITHCVGGVHDECLLGGAMTITLCIDEQQNVLVNFEEEVFWHHMSCIIDHDEHFDHHHVGHWECEHDAFYEFYYNQMMGVVLDILDDDLTSCDNLESNIMSRYSRETCVTYCLTGEEPYWQVSIVNCGNSTACCVLLENWCVNDEGNVEKTFISKDQIGSCTPGNFEHPCPASKKGEEFYPCAARTCR